MSSDGSGEPIRLAPGQSLRGHDLDARRPTRRPPVEMTYLAATALGVVAGDLVLALACYRTRTVLAGIAAVASTILVCLAAGSRWRGSVAEAEAIGGLACLMVGAALLALGQAVDRLLAAPPAEDRPDAPPRS